MRQNKEKVMSATATQKRKVSVDLPTALSNKIDEVVKERHTSVSTVLREAAERYLQEIEDRKLEEALREGYLAFEDLSVEINKEFEWADAEIR